MDLRARHGFSRYLDLKLREGIFAKHSLCLDKLANDEALIEAVARYHGRYEAAKAEHTKAAAQ